MIRNSPVQARSTARLGAILDATAQVINLIGYERLTTATVAERSGASIGTVYRYFPDRISLMQQLAARNEELAIQKLGQAAEDSTRSNPADTLDAIFDALVDLFRNETAFTSLRLGDVLDLGPRTEKSRMSVLAETLFATLSKRYDLPENAQNRQGFIFTLQTAETLLAQLFTENPRGDKASLSEVRAIVQLVFSRYLP